MKTLLIPIDFSGTSSNVLKYAGLVAQCPPDMIYESGLIMAEGDYVMVHGRFSNIGAPKAWVTLDIVRIENGLLAEHWDVIQDEALKAESVSGLPMFGDKFSKA